MSKEGVGGQKKPKSCQHNQCMSNSGRCAFKAEYSPTLLYPFLIINGDMTKMCKNYLQTKRNNNFSDLLGKLFVQWKKYDTW